MSTKDRLVMLNALRKLVGKTPLASWKQAKAKLEEQIAKLKLEISSDDVKDVENVAPKSDNKVVHFPTSHDPVTNPKLPPIKLNTPKLGSKVTPEPNTGNKQNGIGAVIKPLIYKGLNNKEIFEKVSVDHPTMLCTKVDGKWKPTKKWYIAWYRGDLRRKGLLPSDV